MIDIHRMGKKIPHKIRPIKVEMKKSSGVQFILAHAHKLRTSNLRSVYLGLDRKLEERTVYSKLVKEMKQMIEQDSSKHYFIRSNKTSSVDKALSSD